MHSKPDADFRLWRLAILTSPALPLSVLLIPTSYLLPQFYGQVIGLSLSAIGGALLVSRAADAILDPLIGQLSDTTRTRFGRRRPWMIAALPLLILGLVLLYMPPAGAGALHLTVASLIVYLAASMITLPNRAWGTDLVTQYQGRTRLAGLFFFWGLLGVLMASAVPAITSQFGHGIDRYTMNILAWCAILLAPICVIGACSVLPEPRAASVAAPQAGRHSFKAMATLVRNRPFVMLCGAFFILDVGNAIFFGTMVFYVVHYLGAPKLVGLTLLGSVVSSMLLTPAWTALARRIGKHRASAAALVGCSAVCAAMSQVQPGQTGLYAALIIVAGCFGGGFHALPMAMVGDAIDYDRMKTGRERGGLHWGVWFFIQKLAPAVAMGLALPLLEILGFTPKIADGGNTAIVRYFHTLGLVPFALVAAAMLMRFPITAERHRAIRFRLARAEATTS